MSEKEKEKKQEIISDFTYEQVVEMVIFYQEIQIYKHYLLNIHPQINTIFEKIMEITNKAKHSQILLKEQQCQRKN